MKIIKIVLVLAILIAILYLAYVKFFNKSEAVPTATALVTQPLAIVKPTRSSGSVKNTGVYILAAPTQAQNTSIN